ncbi:hypothetical protein COU80_01610 [Candidatus Peregrinibacteria bacterium CG10_big_fil_rev_8_21_14_0_10_55_24]|nr:MAG: hypothetical protein COU80_01610 [Candidatus Peregrinibacteria bacterium CG10_big_fil_rev_8_21_14_0_10_55_24]
MVNYYVTKRGPQWAALRERAVRARLFDKQSDAEAAAKESCKNTGGGEVRIQGRDCLFRDSDTMPPSNDPCPPRDTKH